MMLTDNENKQAKVLDELASFYVSNTNIDFTPPDSPHKVTPPSSDSEQDPPSAIDQSQLEAFSSLFVNTNVQEGPSRRRKSHHPQNRKQSIVAVAMASSVDKDIRRRRGPVSMSQLDTEEYVEMEVPLKGGEDDDEECDNEVVIGGRQPQPDEKGLSALEKLKRRSQSVDVRRVQRSRSDDLAEMDHSRRSSSQDARRRARRRSAEGGDLTGDGLEQGSLHSTTVRSRAATEGLSALEKLKSRSSSMERRRVAPGRSQSDDLLERELRQFCSNTDGRRRSGQSLSDGEDDTSKGMQGTSATVSKGGEDVKGNESPGGENRPISSRSIDRSLNPPVRRKSSDLMDMDSRHRHRRNSNGDNDSGSLAPDAQAPKSDERSNGSAEKPKSRASSRERRRGVPERSKSDDFVDLDSNRRISTHDSRRRTRRSTKLDGDDCSVVSTEIRPSSLHATLVAKSSVEGESSGATNADDRSNTSSEKPKSSRSSSRERRRAATESHKPENTPEVERNESLSNHFGKRRGRRPTGEDASLVESIAETPKIKNSNLDGRGSRHSTRGSRPSHRSKSVDAAFEMDVSRRSSTSDEQRRRRNGSTHGNGDYDEAEVIAKPSSVSSLGLDVQKKPQSARDASRIMAMHGDEAENERKESLRRERRSRSSSQAKWSELRRGMQLIDKAQAHLDDRRNGRHVRRGHSDTSSVVSSSTKEEHSSKSNPRVEKERDASSRDHLGSSDDPSRPISERRMKASENFAAQGPLGQGYSPSSSEPPKDTTVNPTVNPISEATKSEQISNSTCHSDKTDMTESQDDKERLEPKKPQSSAFKNLLGASLGKKTASSASSSDDGGGGVQGESISEESMHKGRTKSGMKVLKKLLSGPSSNTSSDKAETADTAKKGTRWGGLRSGVDFTSRLIRSAAESKKTNSDSDNGEEGTGEGINVSGHDTTATSTQPQESSKDEASSHSHVDGLRERRPLPEENSIDRSSNHMRATDSHRQVAEGGPKSYDRIEKVDPPAKVAPDLYEILSGTRPPNPVEQHRNGDRRGMLTGLAAPSLRFDGNHADGVATRFQPDASTILEEDEEEEEDKSNSRHPPLQASVIADEAPITDEDEGMISGNLDVEEADDDLDTFLSPLKCVQLKFKPTFSPVGNLLVAIHALDHDQENEASDDEESIKVHGMKMDGFELYDDRSPPVSAESDPVIDKSDNAEDINNSKQQELVTEYENLQRQLSESRLRIQASNEALRILQREMQQQTRLFEETKKRGRALKRVLREHNVLLLFN